MVLWAWILCAAVIAYATKLSGYLVPDAVLDHPKVERVTSVLTVALLASLVVLNGLASGRTLMLDARMGAAVVAAIALRLKAPFLLVVILGATTTALLRLLGWG